MEDSRTFTYTVAQKNEGKWKLARFALILFYLIFAGTYVALTASRIPWVISVLPILVWILFFFTWRFVDVSYEYHIESGDLIFTKVMRDKFRRPMRTFKIKDLEAVAPLTDAPSQSQLCAKFDAKELFWAASSLSSSDLYYAIAKNEAGERTLIVFEATSNSLRLLHYYNSATVVTKTRY